MDEGKGTAPRSPRSSTRLLDETGSTPRCGEKNVGVDVMEPREESLVDPAPQYLEIATSCTVHVTIEASSQYMHGPTRASLA